MLFNETHWIRSNVTKMDKPLQLELLGGYRSSSLVPCFLRKLVYKIKSMIRRVPVIVRFNGSQNYRDMKTRVKIKKYRNSKDKYLEGMNCCSAKLSPNAINKLLGEDSIKAIYLDREIRALLDKAGPSLNTGFCWNQEITGKGITTAVIDTGIYPNDDLVKKSNRIVAFKDFVKNKTKPYDDNGHGTHVAGDIAADGFGSNGQYRAPAYESNVAGVKVLDKMGSGQVSTIISGLQWCIDNKDRYNIKIICMSLGGEATQSYKEDILCEAVEAAWNAGIVVCVAAGNEGPKKGSIATPGIDPLIITVGAMDDKNTEGRTDDKMADFSSRGPTIDDLHKPDIVTPGVNIISLRSPNSFLDKQMKSSREGTNYFSLSGTSMATPMCCSVVALMLSKNPQITPQQVKDLLTENAQDMGYDKDTQGEGYVDIEKIISRLQMSPIS